MNQGATSTINVRLEKIRANGTTTEFAFGHSLLKTPMFNAQLEQSTYGHRNFLSGINHAHIQALQE